MGIPDLEQSAAAAAMVSAAALAAGLLGAPTIALHASVALYGLLPLLLAVATKATMARLWQAPLSPRADVAGLLLLAASVALGLPLAALIGHGLLLAAAVLLATSVWKALPGSSVVDTDTDPLTKGDDACIKQLVFAHRFLALGALFLIAGSVTAHFAALWGTRLGLSGTHVLLVGYGLLSVYALGHLWVPRFSGVPAIAAGAIKGELHTTMLGITGLVAGFLAGLPALIMGLGFFVFVGFFTYMGVLGANIMRNKSRTNQVTPEFTYVPWSFAGIFWLISGVLMGLFLNAVPETMTTQLPAMRFTHIHVALVGGVVQLLLSWAIPLATQWQGHPLPPFSGSMKASFYAFNGALGVLVWARFAERDAGMLTALALLALSLGTFARALQRVKHIPAGAPA